METDRRLHSILPPTSVLANSMVKQRIFNDIKSLEKPQLIDASLRGGPAYAGLIVVWAASPCQLSAPATVGRVPDDLDASCRHRSISQFYAALLINIL